MARTRSPNYPVIDLKYGLELTRRLYDTAQRHPMPIVAVVKDAWKFKPGSSYVNQCIGAMRSFGLLVVRGTSDTRQLSVSPEAAKILDMHPERSELLHRAALLPKIHKTVWNRFVRDGGLPPDATIAHYLVHEHEPAFNREKVGRFIKEFRQTIAFAELEAFDTMHSPVTEDEDNGRGGGMTDSQVVDTKEVTTAYSHYPLLGAGMKHSIFPLDEGDVTLQWPESISTEAYEDLSDWLELMARRIKRAVRETKPDEPEVT